jgi:hypothetical protein
LCGPGLAAFVPVCLFGLISGKQKKMATGETVEKLLAGGLFRGWHSSEKEGQTAHRNHFVVVTLDSLTYLR